MSLRLISKLRCNSALAVVRAMSDEASSGGAIREAGGAFGKKGATEEERYFRKLQAQQMETMKKNLEDEVKYHEDQIKSHQDAIKRHKAHMNKLDKQ